MDNGYLKVWFASTVGLHYVDGVLSLSEIRLQKMVIIIVIIIVIMG